MNNLFWSKYKLFSRIGSFWYSLLSDDSKQKARTLTYSTEHTSASSALEAQQNWLVGNEKLSREYESIRLLASRVIILGPELNQRIVRTIGTATKSFNLIERPSKMVNQSESHVSVATEALGDLALAETCEYILVPTTETPDLIIDFEDTRTKFAVKKPTDLIPSCIITETRDLVLGVDFEVCGRHLVFFEHPKDLFKGGYIHVRSGEGKEKSVFSYPLSVDVSGDTRFIAEYFRYHQDAKSFERAIAQAAGFKVLPVTSPLLRVEPAGITTRYIFQDYDTEVEYEHTPLTVGTLYLRGHVVGDMVKAHSSSGGKSWYRSVDWSQGLPLNGLVPFKDLVVQDNVSLATSAEGYHIIRYGASGNLGTLSQGDTLTHGPSNTVATVVDTDELNGLLTLEHGGRPFIGGEDLGGGILLDTNAVDEIFHSKSHVSIPVTGPSAEVSKFKAWVKEVEIRSVDRFSLDGDGRHPSTFLSDILGNSSYINPVQTVFDYLLSNSAVIIELKALHAGPSYRELSLDFIRQHKPVGSIVIVKES